MARELRLAAPADAEGILEIYNPFIRETAVTFEEIPLDSEAMAQRIAEVSKTYPWIVAVEDGGVISGYAYATRHAIRAAYRWSVDVAIYVHPNYRRMGLGENLYRTLFSLLRFQGFANAFAAIALPNAASVGLHEAHGFRACGVFPAAGFKLGAWRDVGWWHLKLLSSEQPLTEPLAIPQARERSDYLKLLAMR